jgi:hypothetical protein
MGNAERRRFPCGALLILTLPRKMVDVTPIRTELAPAMPGIES